MIRRAVFAAFALIFVLSAAAVAALTFPALSGRVVDDAGVLDAATRAELTQTLAALETKSSDQLVVVTLKSLQGTSIEDFGYQFGRSWAIGQKGKNNGILLIVVPSEHRVRIEVGYGLEAIVTDATARLIIENSIVPRFKAGDFPGGIKRGVEDIVQLLTGGDTSEWQQRAIGTSPGNAPPSGKTNSDSSSDGGNGWSTTAVVLGIVLLLIFCALISGLICQILFQIILSGIFSGGSSSGGGGGGFSGGGGSFGGGGASGSW